MTKENMKKGKINEAMMNKDRRKWQLVFRNDDEHPFTPQLTLWLLLLPCTNLPPSPKSWTREYNNRWRRRNTNKNKEMDNKWQTTTWPSRFLNAIDFSTHRIEWQLLILVKSCKSRTRTRARTLFISDKRTPISRNSKCEGFFSERRKTKVKEKTIFIRTEWREENVMINEWEENYLKIIWEEKTITRT